MKRRLFLLSLPTAVWMASGLVAGGRMELVMVEQAGCIWCAKWNREIAGIYPKTPEGRAAPLRRIDLHRPVPEDLTLASKPRLTPTFILVVDGVEQGRIEGYPGEDFFWGMLGQMLENVPAEAG